MYASIEPVDQTFTFGVLKQSFLQLTEIEASFSLYTDRERLRREEVNTGVCLTQVGPLPPSTA